MVYPLQRGYSYARRGRNFSTYRKGYTRVNRSYGQRWRPRRIYVGPSLSRLDKPIKRKGLLDEEFSGGDDWIMAGKEYCDYITMPKIGGLYGDRIGDVVKVVSFNIDGSIRILNVSSSSAVAVRSHMEDDPISTDASCIQGVLGIFIVLDRDPRPTEKPSFEDVFGNVRSGHGFRADLHVKRSALGRFRVLMRHKEVVNEKVPVKILSINKFIGLFGRIGYVTKFRDDGSQGSSGGTYGNIKRNAYLYYIVWDSFVPSGFNFCINQRTSFVN